jgi:hypothetical protein
VRVRHHRLLLQVAHESATGKTARCSM